MTAPQPDQFDLDHLYDALAAETPGFLHAWETYSAEPPAADRLRTAGVLVLLDRLPGTSTWGIWLLKRSRVVVQGGDLSCPGGALQPVLDKFLSVLLKLGGLPAGRGPAWSGLESHGREETALVRLFLATALRETWEETGLNPWRVRFCGPLPPYDLHFFRRTIFPLVGMPTASWLPRLSGEADTLVFLPFTHLLDSNAYARYAIVAPSGDTHLFPCLVTTAGTAQNPEVLWGATFFIIMALLKRLFGFSPPDVSERKRMERHLSPEYWQASPDVP